MDAASIDLLDNLTEFDDCVEVEFRVRMDDVRSVIGLYGGLQRASRGAWYLLVHGKATIRTIDVVSVRQLTHEGV